MTTQVFRHSSNDAYLVALSVLHPMALIYVPSIPVIAIGVWWNSNTISHHFLHLPFFKSNALNRIYSLYLSVLLAIPQTIWRDRHLAHHRGTGVRIRWTSGIGLETTLILALWTLLVITVPHFFLTTYLPGYGLGLVLCYLHGYFEHAGGTTSHHGALYNFAFFNDGYHVEHHQTPTRHWSDMRQAAMQSSRTSPWPALFRWLEVIDLESLEQLVLRSRLLQWFLLRTHENALKKLIPHLHAPGTVTIVGGGMFPRSALLLRKLLPHAAIRIMDADPEHLEMAKPFLREGEIQLQAALFESDHASPCEADLLVIPLSFRGRRDTIYRNPPARAVLVHDWIWNKRGKSAIVSVFLLKRLNLVVR